MGFKRGKQIKKLKELINTDKISPCDAIDELAKILNPDLEKFDIDEEYIIRNKLSEFGLAMLEDTRILNNRITYLNEIMVLLELGVTFDDDELQGLLAKN